MKTQSIITSLIFSLLFLFGCQKESVNPTVSFTINKSIVEVGETVSFTNLSENSTDYLWEFGDGKGSTEIEPTHIYEEVGTYTVKLTAYKYENKDLSTETIEVVYPALYFEPSVRVGDFYLNDDLRTHFAKLDESRMDYHKNGQNLHEFTFPYAGIKFYLYSLNTSYTLDDIPGRIEVFSPFEGQAEGRITFGSSFNEVVNVFGTPLNVVTNTHHHYGGITFFADNSGLVVDRISIQ